MSDKVPSPNPLRMFTWVVVSFMTANLVVFLWLFYFYNVTPSITLSDPIVIGASELCPGDILSYSFAIDTNRTAQVEINIFVVSVLLDRKSPSIEEMIYQLDGNSLLNVQKNWTVPSNWNDPAIPGLIRWAPGPYFLEIQANTSGNNPREDPLLVPFSISRNCTEVDDKNPLIVPPLRGRRLDGYPYSDFNSGGNSSCSRDRLQFVANLPYYESSPEQRSARRSCKKDPCSFPRV